MSHDSPHRVDTLAKIVRMANQIAIFFRSKPREEGIAGIAEHINKFWEPRMRSHLFQMLDAGGQGLDELVIAASAQIRRPAPEAVDTANGAAAGGKGMAAGNAEAGIGTGQG